MKKWMVIMGCALVAVMVGTAVVAWSGEEDEEGYEGMTEEIWCEITACTAEDTGTDEEEDFGLLSDPPAWGCCEYQRVGDSTWRCHCVQPDPAGGPPPTATAFYVGRNGNENDPYTLIAVAGKYYNSAWHHSVCGGCRKPYMKDTQRLLVWGLDSTMYGTNRIEFIDKSVTIGNGVFTTWWSSQDYWHSVTAAGRAGDDHIVGSPQDDWLFGGSGNDSLWGRGGYDSLWGGAGTDYCNCGGGWGDHSPSCNTKVYCN